MDTQGLNCKSQLPLSRKTIRYRRSWWFWASSRLQPEFDGQQHIQLNYHSTPFSNQCFFCNHFCSSRAVRKAFSKVTDGNRIRIVREPVRVLPNRFSCWKARIILEVGPNSFRQANSFSFNLRRISGKQNLNSKQIPSASTLADADNSKKTE